MRWLSKNRGYTQNRSMSAIARPQQLTDPEVTSLPSFYRAILRREIAVTKALDTRSDSSIAQGQLASNLGYLAAAFFPLERLPNG